MVQYLHKTPHMWYQLLDSCYQLQQLSTRNILKMNLNQEGGVHCLKDYMFRIYTLKSLVCLRRMAFQSPAFLIQQSLWVLQFTLKMNRKSWILELACLFVAIILHSSFVKFYIFFKQSQLGGTVCVGTTSQYKQKTERAAGQTPG